MDQATKEQLVARIIAGCVRCKINLGDDSKLTLVIKKPSLEQIYVSYLIAQDYHDELEEFGGMTEDEVLDFMMEHEIWTTEDQQTLDTCIKNIEELKVKLYNLQYKSSQKKTARDYLEATKKEYQRLMTKRH